MVIKHYTQSEILAANNIIIINSFCRLGISFNVQPDNQTGLDTYFNAEVKDFIFKIITNEGEKEIMVGRTHIYELTEPIYINSLVFHNGIPSSIGVDIIFENEEEAE